LRFELYGFGGAGCNIISESNFPSIAVGISQTDVNRCKRSKKLLLDPVTLSGLADADPSVLSPEILSKEVCESISNKDIPVFFAGLGGFAGTNGIKMFASLAKRANKFSISLVSLPFSVESPVRMEIALKSLEDLRKRSDIVISFENDRLASLVPKMPIDKAFKLMNAIMERPVMDLSRVMAESDVSMMRQIAQRSSVFKLGVGLGRGAMRDVEAMKEAFLSPWFDFIREDVPSAFLMISSYPIDQGEVNGIVRDVQGQLPSARLMYGVYEDPTIGDKIRVTLLAGKPLNIG
jgi:cell division protein FtsZ